MENTFISITVNATVNAPLEKVWHSWSAPEHIMQWCSATPEWHVPHATNDLRAGGKFLTRMEAKDGSMGFDFEGVYSEVVQHKKIAYGMSDGRKVEITFEAASDTTTVTETFDAETQNPVEMQRAGWQAILDNFKKYTESI
jgi:uncharacterized protein YndB with AHSA1/START domain